MKRARILLAAILLTPAALPASADPVVCLSCHPDVLKKNPDSAHLKAPVTCESCHGDGTRHVKEGGGAQSIRGFKGRAGAEVCMTCHQSKHVAEWKASRHAQVSVDCIDCHKVHTAGDPKESCQGCH